MHLFPVPISVANYLHWEFKKKSDWSARTVVSQSPSSN